MDAETERWFKHLEDMLKGLTIRFEKVVSGETPCEPAVAVAKLNGRVKSLRLLWIPLVIALLTLAVTLAFR